MWLLLEVNMCWIRASLTKAHLFAHIWRHVFNVQTHWMLWYFTIKLFYAYSVSVLNFPSSVKARGRASWRQNRKWKCGGSVGGGLVTTRLLIVRRESLLRGHCSCGIPRHAFGSNPSQFALWLLWFVVWNQPIRKTEGWHKGDQFNSTLCLVFLSGWLSVLYKTHIQVIRHSNMNASKHSSKMVYTQWLSQSL